MMGFTPMSSLMNSSCVVVGGVAQPAYHQEEFSPFANDHKSVEKAYQHWCEWAQVHGIELPDAFHVGAKEAIDAARMAEGRAVA